MGLRRLAVDQLLGRPRFGQPHVVRNVGKLTDLFADCCLKLTNQVPGESQQGLAIKSARNMQHEKSGQDVQVMLVLLVAGIVFSC